MKEQAYKSFQPEVEAKDLLGLLRGYQQAVFFYQAFRTGIFDCLTTELQSVATLAGKLGFRPERTVFLLDALTAIGLAEKEGDHYRTVPVSSAYLRRDSRFYLGDMLDMDFSAKQSSDWGMLPSWLKGVSNGGDHSPQAVFQPSFVRAMAQGVLSEDSVARTADLVSSHSCFATARNLLDLGGGHGLFPLALQKKKPDLRITVFDLPQVKEVTEEYAAAFGGEVHFQGGNFYEDELPANQDIVLAFDILHPVPPSRKEEVFRKVYGALNSGGYLFYKLWFLDESRTKPRRAAIFALKCQITNSQAHVYTAQEAAGMLAKLGFAIEDSLPVGDEASTMLVARKPLQRP